MVKAKPRAGEAQTLNYGWTKPTVGASDDLWGGYINADLDSIDSIVHGLQTSIPAPYVLPTASTTVLGGVKVDGTTVTIAGGTISALKGVTDGSNAPAGQIGEVISAVNSAGSGIAAGTPGNVASLNLTPGDWDISADIHFTASATMTIIVGGISLTSASFPSSSLAESMGQLSGNMISTNVMVLRPCRASLTTATSYYLTAQANFPSGTCTVSGTIWARRAR